MKCGWFWLLFFSVIYLHKKADLFMLCESCHVILFLNMLFCAAWKVHFRASPSWNAALRAAAQDHWTLRFPFQCWESLSASSPFSPIDGFLVGVPAAGMDGQVSFLASEVLLPWQQSAWIDISKSATYRMVSDRVGWGGLMSLLYFGN